MHKSAKKTIFTAIVLATLCLAAASSVIAGGIEKEAFFSTGCLTVLPDFGTSTVLENGNIQIRDMVTIQYSEATDDRITGYYKVVINVNVDATWKGVLWGTIESCDEYGEPISDGWKGTYHGQYFYWPPDNALIESTGHGIGAYKGLKFTDTRAITGGGGGVVGTIQGTSE
jgi:hypothetical protein